MVILVAMLLPALVARTKRGSFINCVNNLKQVGPTFLVWAEDHNGKIPMEVSAADGGTMELAVTLSVWAFAGGGPASEIEAVGCAALHRLRRRE